jgi:hypothetical protein
MRNFRAFALLFGLGCTTLLGCSGGDAALNEPMTEEQLAEQDKRVQAEEEAHFKQMQANAPAQTQPQGE